MRLRSTTAPGLRHACAALMTSVVLVQAVVSATVARADAGDRTASEIVAAAEGRLTHSSTGARPVPWVRAASLDAGPCGVRGGYFAQDSGQTSSCTDFGTRAHAWCADFAGWVWQQAGVPGLETLNDLAESFKGYGLINGTWSSTPAVGDAIYFHPLSADGTHHDHVAIVTAINEDGTLETIGGNERTATGVVAEDVGMPSAVGAVAWLDGRVPVQVAGYAAPEPSASEAPTAPHLDVPAGQIGGAVALRAYDSDPSVRSVTFSVDGEEVGTGAENEDSYTFVWDTTPFTEGTHTIAVTASGPTGVKTVTAATVDVTNSAVRLDHLLPVFALVTGSQS